MDRNNGSSQAARSASLRAVLGGEHKGPSSGALEIFAEMQAQLTRQDEWIDDYDARIQRLSRQNEEAARLMEIPAFGPLNSTAFIAAVGDPHRLRPPASLSPSGRHLAANTGLTPHEHSSGGKQRLFGISKRGDRYLRTLLIHGARRALRCAEGKQDRLLLWALKAQGNQGL
ncbi:MAG: IS110 family transposase [Gammaproteobacteria bacterium]|nr:IS110 family transposase [Gammaproteobacteria bacterium]